MFHTFITSGADVLWFRLLLLCFLVMQHSQGLLEVSQAFRSPGRNVEEPVVALRRDKH